MYILYADLSNINLYRLMSCALKMNVYCIQMQADGHRSQDIVQKWKFDTYYSGRKVTKV